MMEKKNRSPVLAEAVCPLPSLLRRSKIAPMLHHISLPVKDLEASKALYDATMETIGYRCVVAVDRAVGYGTEDGKDKLLLKLNLKAKAASEGFHLAFAAPSQEAVDNFHRAALEHGAWDNGAPGLRKAYGPNYYAAFVIDIDGHRLEVVHK